MKVRIYARRRAGRGWVSAGPGGIRVGTWLGRIGVSVGAGGLRFLARLARGVYAVIKP